MRRLIIGWVFLSLLAIPITSGHAAHGDGQTVVHVCDPSVQSAKQVQNCSQVDTNGAQLNGIIDAAGDRVLVDASGQLLVNPGAASVSNDSIAAVPSAYTSLGATPYKLVSAATNNATSLKASAGQIYGIQAVNINAAVRYLKLYNKATAPTCGTDTPVKVIAIPGGTTGGLAQISFPVGISFATGIGFCIVTGITDADNTATAASEQVVNIDYK